MPAEPLTEREQVAAKLLSDSVLDGTEGPMLKLAGRCAAITLDRWGRDLTRDATDQQWSAWQTCLDEAAGDVLEHYADEDADVAGIEAPVFEGVPVGAEELADAAEEVVAMVEQEVEFDRHEPGPLVERRAE